MVTDDQRLPERWAQEDEYFPMVLFAAPDGKEMKDVTNTQVGDEEYPLFYFSFL